MATDMVDLASVATEATATPAADSTAVATETPSATSGTDDLQVIDSSTEGAEESVEGKETDTHNPDGTEKTTEQKEDFKAKAENRAPLPAEVRSALKVLKELDPKNAAVVKQLHGHFERFEAIKEALGTEGPNGLKNFLQEVGAKNITEARATLAKTQEMIDTVKNTDELLYKADPVLSHNVYEEMKANGTEKNYGKVVSNFVSHLKEADATAYYDEVAKPLVLEGMDSAGLPAALNSLHKALVAGGTETAKSITKSIAKFYTDLRDETGEKAKISKERQAWEAERTSKETESQKVERSKAENGVAEECEKTNNVRLGKALGGFLRLSFFKDFPRETLVDLGNGIKERLYAALKADNNYQTQMDGLWKAKALDRAKMVQVHQAKLEEIGDRIVRETVQNRYPGYARGGSSQVKAAAATDKKAAAAKAGAASVATNRPIYVASKPQNLQRADAIIGGRKLTTNDLQVLEISGKGYVKSADGKSWRFISWRKG